MLTGGLLRRERWWPAVWVGSSGRSEIEMSTDDNFLRRPAQWPIAALVGVPKVNRFIVNFVAMHGCWSSLLYRNPYTANSDRRTVRFSVKRQNERSDIC